MARLKNIEKVAAGLGLKHDNHGDGSGSWIEISNDHFSVTICFDGKGDKFESVQISKKIWQVVDEPVIAKIKAASGHTK